MSKIIGISGKKLTGKDTTADIMASLHHDVVKYWFAMPLKMEVARACGVSVEFINAHKSNFRLILQGWGTDFRRKLYRDDYWVRQMDSALNQLASHKIIVIPDVRFPNEYNYIASIGGTLVRVERNTGLADTHESETALDDYPFDFRLSNNGTINELVELVKQIT